MPDTHCLVCRSTDIQVAKSVCWDITGLGALQTGFGYCRDCGHIMQVPVPSDGLLETYYANFSNYTILDEKWQPPEVPSVQQRRFLDMAARHAGAPGHIMEIGCAVGLHLYYYEQADWKVSGCEPSPKAAAQGRELLGLEIEIANAEITLPRQRNLDAILISHVLEHFSNPLEILRLAHEALRDDGVLIFEVPCARCPELLPPGWFTLEHISYFSEISIRNVLALAGFETLEIITDDISRIAPVMGGIARKSSPCSADQINRDSNFARSFLKDYLARDVAKWGKIDQLFGSMSGDAYIFAAGVHTSQLFDETSAFERLSVKAIIDSDKQKVGKTQQGVPIISLASMMQEYNGENVVISSYASEETIARILAVAGIPDDRIVRLYNTTHETGR